MKIVMPTKMEFYKKEVIIWVLLSNSPAIDACSLIHVTFTDIRPTIIMEHISITPMFSPSLRGCISTCWLANQV